MTRKPKPTYVEDESLFNVDIWNHMGDVVRHYRDVTATEVEDIRDQYEDEPYLDVVVEDSLPVGSGPQIRIGKNPMSDAFDRVYKEIGIVERLRFDATRCNIQFSKGVAGNIEEAADEIERLRTVLKDIYHESKEALIRNMAWDAVSNRPQK